MPNWVYNGLTIEGKPESVKALIKQLNQPFKMVHDNWNMETMQQEKKLTTYPNPVFAFWNIIKPTDMEAYWAEPAKREAGPITFDSDHWYDWNIRNWGTKWDVAIHENEQYSDTSMEDSPNGENHVVHYNFNTAWSRPLPALFKLSEQYPELLFTHSYQEETGWGGEMEILRGEIISESEYDSQCRDCDATDCMEYCENDCGEICNVCHWLGEADLDEVAKCDDHKIYLDTKVPEYRKVSK
jgi:hypothetical protein